MRLAAPRSSQSCLFRSAVSSRFAETSALLKANPMPCAAEAP
uniref:Uncharacterized protein n=1 Tax=Arundo donax TaxID=35708 RepID=A0A0A9CEN7_ARUDO